MNNSDFFVNPIQTIHMVSVLSSINVFSNIFYSEKLLTKENQHKPIEIVNILCNYLSKNESEETIIALGHKVLSKTDLFGAKENETLHIKYVDAMFDHIITSVIFFEFHNTFGYLSLIVNSTDNLYLSLIKPLIVQDLKNRTYLNKDKTISKLTDLTIRWVTEKLIFPLFPQPENDMKIYDTDYIYAQAGLMLARSAGIQSNNISFQEYITMAQIVEQGVLVGQINQDGLRIFQLPALLYFTHKRKHIFRKRNMKIFITSEEIWEISYKLLFSDLKVAGDKFIELLDTNPEYQFQKAFSEYKNRTHLAEETLRKECPLDNENDYETEVSWYKYYYSNYDCKANKSKRLPDINEIFSEQNKRIANKYFLYEQALIREIFGEKARTFFNHANATFTPATLFYSTVLPSRRIPTRTIKINDNVDLFSMKILDMFFLFALVREGNGITLVPAEPDNELFREKIGISKTLRYGITSEIFTNLCDPIDTFLTKLARSREKQFVEMLHELGYEATKGEKAVAFLKNLIPFYSCYKSIESGVGSQIAFFCPIDLLVVVPIVGEVSSISLKFASAALKPLLVSLRTSMRTFAVRELINLSIKTGIRVIALEAGREISKMITKELFMDIGIAILRTLDPGIELSFIIGKAGIKAITKCFSLVLKRIPSLSHILQSFKSMKQTVIAKVGSYGGHSVSVNSISGQDGYGTKYFYFDDQMVELRRVRGYQTEIPVISISSSKTDKKIYRKFNLKTGEPYGLDLELKNNILEVLYEPLSVRLKNIQVTGLSGKGSLEHFRTLNYLRMCAKVEEGVSILKSVMSEEKALDILNQFVLDKIGNEPVDFAKHYIRTKEYPEWSKSLHLHDRQIYEILRYNTELDDIRLTSDIAVTRIINLYGEDYIRDVIRVIPLKMFKLYLQNKYHTLMSFDDFYALGNFVLTGMTRIDLELTEAWHMQRALYSFIFRQADLLIDYIPKSLYSIQWEIYNQFPVLEKGSIFTLKNFMTAKNDVPFSNPKISSKHSLKVLYTISLDNQILFTPVFQHYVIIPGIKFVVEDIKHEIINGEYVLQLSLKNLPVDKSIWLTILANRIASLMKKEISCNIAVNTFDLTLLD